MWRVLLSVITATTFAASVACAQDAGPQRPPPGTPGLVEFDTPTVVVVIPIENVEVNFQRALQAVGQCSMHVVANYREGSDETRDAVYQECIRRVGLANMTVMQRGRPCTPTPDPRFAVCTLSTSAWSIPGPPQGGPLAAPPATVAAAPPEPSSGSASPASVALAPTEP